MLLAMMLFAAGITLGVGLSVNRRSVPEGPGAASTYNIHVHVPSVAPGPAPHRLLPATAGVARQHLIEPPIPVHVRAVTKPISLLPANAARSSRKVNVTA